MNQSPRNIVVVIGFFIAIALSFYGGIIYSDKDISSTGATAIDVSLGGNAPDIDLEPLWKSWKIVKDKYVFSDAPTDQEKLWGAIGGVVNSIGDPYSVFLPPIESAIFNEDIKGNFGGVGMEIGIEDDILTVIAPLSKTPAKRAGILAGDKIIAIDDESTAGLTIDMAVSLIRGEIGTKVKLSIFREEKKEDGKMTSKTLDIEVERANIVIPTIETRLEDGIFVIELFNFSRNSTTAFREALRQFVDIGSDKLIIDLRGNPGGFLDAAVDMASYFIPLGREVVREDMGLKGVGTVYRSKGFRFNIDNIKIVIIVDKGSASASEILAGALSEHNIATLVGTQTFGKGSVQELIQLTSDTFIKITIAKWLTPNGNSITDNGLTPDFIVEMTAEDRETGRDPQLDKAKEILLN